MIPEAAVAMLPVITLPDIPAVPPTMLSSDETIKNGTGAPLAIEVYVNGELTDPPTIVKIDVDDEYKLPAGQSTAEPGSGSPAITAGPVDWKELVILAPNKDTDPIEKWEFKIYDPPSFGGDEKAEKQWNDFKKEFYKLKALRDEYADAKALAYIPSPGDPNYEENKGTLIKQKEKIEKEAEVAIRKAENTMKDLFTSPYLLPGMWAALFPSIFPLGGGINPWPGTIPSTIPGMIYIALLFIDAIEEKTHDEQQKLNDPKCEDQL